MFLESRQNVTSAKKTGKEKTSGKATTKVVEEGEKAEEDDDEGEQLSSRENSPVASEQEHTEESRNFLNAKRKRVDSVNEEEHTEEDGDSEDEFQE